MSAAGEWLTPREAARLLGTDERNVHTAIRSGEVRARPVTYRPKFELRAKDVLALVASRRGRAARKRDALAMLADGAASIRTIAARTGFDVTTVCKWKQKMRQNAAPAVVEHNERSIPC
jgi:hypothetical protein